MKWLQRNSWWGLLALNAVGVVFGFVDLISGVTYQAEDLTGKTIAQIAAESGAGSRLSDYAVRTDGLHIITLGVLWGVIVYFAFRRDHRWAWWATWTMPVTIIAASVKDLSFGVWGPAISGAIVAAVPAVILLISAPRFFRQPSQAGKLGIE